MKCIYFGSVCLFYLAANVSSDSGSSDSRVHFRLVRKDKPVINSNISDEKLFDGALTTKKPLIILIPGYRTTPEKEFVPFLKTMITAYFQRHDVQIVIVFWDDASEEYGVARSRVKSIAKVLARFFERLENEEGLSMRHLTVIGQSFGAHIGGSAGKMTNGSIGRMIGLDSTSRGYFFAGEEDVISTKSARFVQAIHTCSNNISIPEPLGHVDFYPNNGDAPQPGCETDTEYDDPSCSHQRAFKYYAESINSLTAFVGVKCADSEEFETGSCDNNERAYMGQITPRTTRGSYFLRTGSSSPYGLGVSGINSKKK